MRLKGLNLAQLEPAAEFIEKAYARGWTSDPLIDILTRLQNSSISDLNQQSMDLLRDFLECAKSRNLKLEHIIQISQKTEDQWKRIVQDAYDLGYKHGVEHYRVWLVKLVVETFKNSDLVMVGALDRVIDLAQQKAMDDPSVPR